MYNLFDFDFFSRPLTYREVTDKVKALRKEVPDMSEAISNIEKWASSTLDYSSYRIHGDEPGVYYLEVFLPGYDKENLSVTLTDDNNLVVSAQATPKTSSREYYVRGFRQGSVKKAIPIGAGVEVTSATYVNGVLVVKLLDKSAKSKKATSVPIE